MCVLEMLTNDTPYRECVNVVQIYKTVTAKVRVGFIQWRLARCMSLFSALYASHPPSHVLLRNCRSYCETKSTASQPTTCPRASWCSDCSCPPRTNVLRPPSCWRTNSSANPAPRRVGGSRACPCLDTAPPHPANPMAAKPQTTKIPQPTTSQSPSAQLDNDRAVAPSKHAGQATTPVTDAHKAAAKPLPTNLAPVPSVSMPLVPSQRRKQVDGEGRDPGIPSKLKQLIKDITHENQTKQVTETLARLPTRHKAYSESDTCNWWLSKLKELKRFGVC